MKKGIVLLCLLVCIGSLVGFLFSTKLVENSEKHGIAKIDKKNDVVGKIGDVTNLDKFQQFLTRVKSGQTDQVRIVHYTDEGDPIFQTLEYDGIEIRYTSDNSQDKFAGKDKGIESDTCKKITKDIREEGIRYTLNDCMKEAGRNGYELLSVPAK
ncbi:DUF4362 domain-containing protein [Bacillus sp. DX4.1]|uniref:DUF4362 domain-containing protein n=1 Tax=Bacillus sp. DX4.1 TaxID=3055867 RepID=UPI0025A2EDEA|nr:DUF4362 domain-containing protein [Bacillus sp. DX4.1]MDM5190738.1 DUF4362 domain-containing protein [Bacillus sp. DX4.1]